MSIFFGFFVVDLGSLHAYIYIYIHAYIYNYRSKLKVLEEDKDLYSCIPGSKLQGYLEEKVDKIFTFLQIVRFFATYLVSKEMYDPKNTSIIVFDQDLEEVFDVKAMLKSDFSKMLHKHLKLIKQNGFSDMGKAGKTQTDITISPSRTPTRHTFEHKYYVLKDLAHCLSLEAPHLVLTYSEIKILVKGYLTLNKDRLCSQRHEDIVHCSHDALGVTLDVNYFHLKQLDTLLAKQVVYLHPRLYPDLYREE